MTINALDDLVNALSNTRQRLQFSKASTINQSIGGYSSYWKALTSPYIGATPTTQVILNNSTAGGLLITNPTSPNSLYLSKFRINSSLGATSFELHDRLMHMGGLSGSSTSSQTASLDLHSNIASENLAARIGESDYSGVQWWIEIFTALGAAGSTITVSYTDQTATSRTATVTLPSGNKNVGQMYRINPVEASTYIRTINSVQLSGSTGAAGNFGLVATVFKAGINTGVAYMDAYLDCASSNLVEISSNSCLTIHSFNNSTTNAAIFGSISVIQG